MKEKSESSEINRGRRRRKESREKEKEKKSREKEKGSRENEKERGRRRTGEGIEGRESFKIRGSELLLIHNVIIVTFKILNKMEITGSGLRLTVFTRPEFITVFRSGLV